ncbi:MAG: phosphoribosylanthranilate isomerase [Opitutae bacterium]|nr:phosphoribosylanthranilate isomerase [Opitutae bacterium]|tara:strand:- start:968 stop:1615 length:648 start_codon:yes stop_codon:yes gene_type:complete
MTVPEIKVCGITRPEDATFALTEGADFLGFILYHKSPRRVTLQEALALFDAAEVPKEKRVAVDVNPNPSHLSQLKKEGFSLFQLHFPFDLPRARIGEWVQAVGSENLWLAPKLRPGESFPEDLTTFASSFLIDGFSPDAYGGTGQSADWNQFAEWRNSWADKDWILAGGLSPENVSQAVAISGASRVDANSGVESAPGIKDAAKIRAFFASLNPT